MRADNKAGSSSGRRRPLQNEDVPKREFNIKLYN